MKGEIQGNEIYFLKILTWQQANFSIKAGHPHKAQEAGVLALGLNWPETSARCKPAAWPLCVSGSFGTVRLCTVPRRFPPIFPEGITVKINKIMFVDFSEPPERKTLQQAMHSLAWIIYSRNMELWKCEKKISNHIDSILIIVDLFATNSENAVSMIWDVSSTWNVIFHVFKSWDNILGFRCNQNSSVSVLGHEHGGPIISNPLESIVMG